MILYNHVHTCLQMKRKIYCLPILKHRIENWKIGRQMYLKTENEVFQTAELA